MIHLSNFDNLIEENRISFLCLWWTSWNTPKKEKKFIPSPKWAGWKERPILGNLLDKNSSDLRSFQPDIRSPLAPCCTVKSRLSVRNPSRLRVCLGICESTGTRERKREKDDEIEGRRGKREREREADCSTLCGVTAFTSRLDPVLPGFHACPVSGSRDATNPVF